MRRRSCRRALLALLAAGTALSLLLHTLPRQPPPPAAAVTQPVIHNETSPITATPPRDVNNRLAETQTILHQDLYAAEYERAQPELCPSLGAKLKLLILVASAPSHSKARNAIRLTWARPYVARRDVAIAFVLGAAPDNRMCKIVKREADLYGDVIIGRFDDSYFSLTLKTVSMLKWTTTFCPHVQRLLKTDDDMFINVPRLLKFIDAHATHTNTIWGNVWNKAHPVRDEGSKHFISMQQYPLQAWPAYTNGPAYLLTSDVIKGFLKLAPSQPYIPIEDVFITGLLAARLGVKRVHAGEFTAPGFTRSVVCTLMKGIAVHGVRYHEQLYLWSKLLDGNTTCPLEAPPDHQ